MARCVIVRDTVDTDAQPEWSWTTQPACVIHKCLAPCWHNGEPANPAPMHMGAEDRREESVRWWWKITRCQRTLVLHQGSLADDRDHDISDRAECWCGPEVFAATPEPAPMPVL